MQHDDDRNWIINVPAVVGCLLVVFLAVHVIRLFLPADLDNSVVLALAFIPARYDGSAELLQAIPGGWLAALTSFVTHMFVHGDWTHLIFNSAWMLAFGGALALRVGAVRFLALAAFSGFCGAVLFLIVNFAEPVPMIGASGAVSGLMGAAMRFFFSAMDYGGLQILRESPRSVPLMTLQHALNDQRVIMVTVFWVGINLLSVVGFGLFGSEAGGIAWEAHIGGYTAGLLSMGWFERPPSKPGPVRLHLH